MKLKPVVASLALLGLMTPVFAKSTLLSQQAVIDQNSAVAPLCEKNWFERISVGGMGSVVGLFGDRDPVGTFASDKHGSDLYVNNLNLLVDAKLSSWSKATVNLAYLGHPILWKQSENLGDRNWVKHSIVADEAYVTIGDLAKYPFYMVVGKKYVPFGDYSDPYAPLQIMSPAQMLSEINAPTVIAGVSSDFGMYASIFALKGEYNPAGSANAIRNFGAKIGYYDNLDQFNTPNTHVNFAVSYINNLLDSRVFTANAIPEWESRSDTKKIGLTGYNKDSVRGLSVHGDLAYKAFSMSANWVGALKNMKEGSGDNSKFWGADVNLDYSFKTLDHNSHLGATVQWSGNGKWFSAVPVTDFANIIPEWRLMGEYKVNLFKNTDLNLVVAHSKNYEGATVNKKSTLGLARLMFQL